MSDLTSRPVTVAQITDRGMITLRCDFSDASVGAAIQSVTGCPVPDQRRIVSHDDGILAWMSHDELLVTCDRDSVPDRLGAFSQALAPFHHLAVDVTHARAMFEINGEVWRDVLGKGMPVDFRPDRFGNGDIRRSRLGQIAVAVWSVAPDQVSLVCFRSVSEYVETWLATATMEGSLPGHY